MIDTEFRSKFCARTRAWRRATGMTMQQMADALGIHYEGYRTYELITPLPHHLIIPFTVITGSSLPALFTGHPSPSSAKPRRTQPTPTQRRIMAIRRRLGLTQVQFAEHLGIAFGTVNRWERGHCEPQPATWRHILEPLESRHEEKVKPADNSD